MADASGAAGAAGAADAADDVTVFDGWRLDPQRRELHRPDGRAVILTGSEFDLLNTFVRHANQVLSRERLMDLAKGRDWAAYDRAIDTLLL